MCMIINYVYFFLFKKSESESNSDEESTISRGIVLSKDAAPAQGLG